MDIKTSYSDEQLVRLAQKGNINAYNILLGRYYNKIQQIIYFWPQSSFRQRVIFTKPF